MAPFLQLILLNKKYLKQQKQFIVLSSNIYCSCTVQRSWRWFWAGAKCLFSQNEKRCVAHSETTPMLRTWQLQKPFFLALSETTYLSAPPTITQIPDLTEGSSVFTSGTLRRKGEYWQSPTQKYFARIGLCCHDKEMSAKSADIWLLGQHVANIPSQAACERQLLCCAVHEECFFTQKGPE